MKNLLTTLLAALASRFKSKIGKAILSVLIASVILRYPWLVGWLDTGLQQTIFNLADTLKENGLLVILFFVKGFNETGGTDPLTIEAKTRIQK